MKTRARSSDVAPGAMAQTWISIAAVAVLVAAILLDHARGGELMDCEPQRVSVDGRHWAYRIIDGRECWYPGERGKPKGELRWSEAASAPQRSGVLEQAEVEGSPPSPTLALAAESRKPGTTEAIPGEWRAAAADQFGAARGRVAPTAGARTKTGPAAGMAADPAAARTLRDMADPQAGVAEAYGAICFRLWPVISAALVELVARSATKRLGGRQLIHQYSPPTQPGPHRRRFGAYCHSRSSTGNPRTLDAD